MRCPWAILLLTAPVLLFARPSGPATRVDPATPDRGLVAWKPLARGSEFRDVPHITSTSPDCSQIHPPQALTTPAPMMSRAITSTRAKVSFIIGTDGQVHSPLILESAGASGDRSILRAVRIWKFRPATCNGVPTEAEGKIEFSSY